MPPPDNGRQRVEYCDLLILDDILPSDFSPFRTIEYGHYLSFFDARIASLEGWNLWVSNEGFDEALGRLPLADPALRARIHRFDEISGIAARLAYVTFLGNAHPALPYLTQRRLPFVLQLYPGGGMAVDQPETDAKLREVLLSPLCRKVIVTQTITRDYVTERIGLDPAKVEFVFGGVFESRIGFDFTRDKRRFPRDKATLDLCFVAHKYGDDLTSKGYDRFVAIARALAPRFPELHFHVVGDYREDDLPLGEAAARFTFHGRRPSAFFEEFYLGMDAIVSLNRPFVLAPGAYDGFPTGACIEAGFRGVLNCINDPLRLNPCFEEGRDIVLLGDGPGADADAVARLAALLAEPERLYALARANWRRFHEVLGTDRQLWARTRVIAAELLRSEVLVTAPGPWAGAEANAAVSAVARLRGRCTELETEIRRLVDAYRQRDDAYQHLEAAYRELEATHRRLEATCSDLAASAATLEALRKMPGYRMARGAYRRLRAAAARLSRSAGAPRRG